MLPCYAAELAELLLSASNRATSDAERIPSATPLHEVSDLGFDLADFAGVDRRATQPLHSARLVFGDAVLGQ